jgi:hypothetical protein
MIHAIDHMVILVDDLGAATAGYAALGFTVTPGGTHADGTTHNVLVVFADDTYLELIAFRRPAPAHRWWRHALHGAGLIDFALLPTAIESDVAAAEARGLPFGAPTAGGRVRPDGQAVAWASALPTTPDLPFLCADVTPRALRVPTGAAREHPNGALGIAEVRVAVADIAASAARYRALLGVDGSQSFALGAGVIVLAAGDAAGERLARRGEGPLALKLITSATGGVLDSARTQGVPIELVARGSNEHSFA